MVAMVSLQTKKFLVYLDWLYLEAQILTGLNQNSMMQFALKRIEKFHMNQKTILMI